MLSYVRLYHHISKRKILNFPFVYSIASDFLDHDSSTFASETAMNSISHASTSDSAYSGDYSSLCTSDEELSISPVTTQAKRRKTQHFDTVKFDPHESVDLQARRYLADKVTDLTQRITSTQLQLQVLSLQLQCDLPQFVASAIQLFRNNNQHVLEESPTLYYLKQKEFIDQAVCIHLSQFTPKS